MTISLWLFGCQVVCLTIGPTEVETEAVECDGSGYTAGTYVGFANHTAPEEVPAPQHCPSWDEPDE